MGVGDASTESIHFLLMVTPVSKEGGERANTEQFPCCFWACFAQGWVLVNITNLILSAQWGSCYYAHCIGQEKISNLSSKCWGLDRNPFFLTQTHFIFKINIQVARGLYFHLRSKAWGAHTWQEHCFVGLPVEILNVTWIKKNYFPISLKESHKTVLSYSLLPLLESVEQCNRGVSAHLQVVNVWDSENEKDLDEVTLGDSGKVGSWPGHLIPVRGPLIWPVMSPYT